ncbi:MAG: TonB-dependent receptor [Ignavibacteriae bacterium]|nr:MAG: TonB-dependent receptor [Ignavibacteriota bacterium]
MTHIIRISVFFLILEAGLPPAFAAPGAASSHREEETLQEVKIKLYGGDYSLEQIFRLIEQQTAFRFFYLKEDLPLEEKMNMKVQDCSLFQLLQELSGAFDVVFKRIDNQIVVKKAFPVRAKTCEVSGVVRGGQTHELLVFASIAAKKVQLGAATDARGKFLLHLPRGTDTLRCSYVGYKTEEIPVVVDNDLQVNITLMPMDVLLQDVTIYAYQGGENELASGNALSLQSEKIKTSTSIFPDVLRSVQMLPGVSANNEFNARFNVRGGNPDENLVLVNGTQVYDPYHLKWAANYSIGVMNTELIDKMDLMTGGFPARYGDKMSSVLNIDYREGDKDRYTGRASLSLTDVDIVAEGPLSENGSFIVGAKKTYLEYILKLVTPKAKEATIFPTFYDVQGVVSYSLNPGQRLYFKFLHAGDDLSNAFQTQQSGPFQSTSNSPSEGLTQTQVWNDTTDARAQYYSTLLALQSVNVISSSTILKTEFSFYDQRENALAVNNHYYRYQGVKPGDFYFNNYTTHNDYHNDLRIRTLELNSALDQQWSSHYGIKTGISYQRLIYAEDQNYQRTIDQAANYGFGRHPDTTIIHQSDNPMDFENNQMNTHSFKLAGYCENIVQVNDQMLLNIGGRFDYFDLNKNLTWSPRVNLAYQIRTGLAIRGAWGYYYQSPNYRQVAYPAASDTNTQSQRAIHYVLGADYTVDLHSSGRSFLKMKVELFYKKYDNLMSVTQTSQGDVYYSRKNDAMGDSKGVDVYVMYSAPGFYGWASYSILSTVQDVLKDAYGSFPRNTDQTHTLAVVGEIHLGSQWNLTVRYTYGSGYPYSPQGARYNTTTYQWDWFSGQPNSERLPSYSCLDLRITKSFEMFGLATSAFLDVSNLLMAKNIIAYRYHIENGQPVKNGINLPPLVPSMGMSVRF